MRLVLPVVLLVPACVLAREGTLKARVFEEQVFTAPRWAEQMFRRPSRSKTLTNNPRTGYFDAIANLKGCR